MASPGFLSKRQTKKPQSGLTSDRYQYLGLEQAEADLGDPLVGVSSIGAKPKPISGDVFILAAYSTRSTTGISTNRFWVPTQDITGGLSLTPGSFTVFNNDVQVGLANSFNKFNFVGTGVTVDPVGSSINEQTGIATVRISVTDAIAKGGFSAVQYHGAGGLIQGAGDFAFDPNTNRVGIGSTLPKQKLDVNGNIIISGVSTFVNGPIIINSLSDTGTLNQKLQVTGGGYFSDSVGIGTTNPLGSLQVGAGTSAFVVTASGSVGIGITDPGQANLAIVNNTQASFSIGQNVDGSGADHLGFFYGINGNGNPVGVNAANIFTSNGDMRFDVDGNGSAGSGFAFGRAFGDAAVGGATWVVIDSSGNVGIGTTVTTSKLHVVGVTTFGGNVFVQNDHILYVSNIADRFGLTGSNGARLIKDNIGIAWTTSSEVAAGGTIRNIQFHANSGLIDGNNGFNYDFTNQRVGIGTTNPIASLQVGAGTSSFIVTEIGSVGIRTTTLSESKLTILGGINVKGGITSAGGELNLIVTSSDIDNIPATITQSASVSTLQVFSGGISAHSSRGGQIDFIAGFASTNPGCLIFRTGTATTSASQKEVGRFTSTGNLGIGTTNPTAPVSIANTAVLAAGIVTAYKFYGDGSGLTGITPTVTSSLNFFDGGLNPFVYTVGIGTTVVTGTATTAINYLGITTFRSVKYQIQIAQNQNFQATDLLVIHNGTTANLIEYGSIATGEYLGVFGASISGGNLNLDYTPNVSAAATISVAYHAMRII